MMETSVRNAEGYWVSSCRPGNVKQVLIAPE